MARHRLEPGPRLRRGRAASLGAALLVTGVAVLGGVGLLPGEDVGDASAVEVARDPAPRGPVVPAPQPVVRAVTVQPAVPPPVPAGSGAGRRVVFAQAEQRVWLVDADEAAVATYLVSGSLGDNLQPGSYEVFSRSEDAWGIDDSGTMKWFVRFTRGPSGAAIGFHDIPIDDGALVQRVADLGTPQSHGCIRQKRVRRQGPVGLRTAWHHGRRRP